MSDKYLIIEQIKFDNFGDTWSVKYSNQSYNDTFIKLTALETLKDNDNKIYYIVNQKHLWSKDLKDTDDNEIKTATQETKQQELF